MRHPLLKLTPLALALTFAACGDDITANPDSGGRSDAGPGSDDGSTGDGGRADTGPIVRPDGGPTPDSGPVGTACNNPPLTAPPSGTCKVTAGGAATLIRGDIVVPNGLLSNGHLLIGADGKIACAACDCSGMPGFQGATVLECAKGVVSPGLINAHDHITYTEAPPAPHGETRYDHRHEWRRGINGKPRIPSAQNEGGNRGVSWGELRQVMAGGTSVNGSGGAAGLTRNLDQMGANQEGLGVTRIRYSTFPLGDTNGQLRTSDCSYPTIESPDTTAIRNGIAYTPHIAEGVNQAARNEFLCLSRTTGGAKDVILSKTAIIHGVGLLPQDYDAMARDGAALIWSPRSNIDLYGHTAPVTVAARLGVAIALGTDWCISGSMNALRELRCADGYNRTNLGGFFNDRALVDMVTSGAASALSLSDKIGVLDTGREADIAIFDASRHGAYRAILDAEPQEVVLVLRSGKVLYGDQDVVSALPESTTGCENLPVCGRMKRACVQRETGSTIAELRGAIADDAYDLFFCGAPPDEPSCTPFRPNEFTGMPSAMDSDGDGIADSRDLCPTVFDPPRPLDGDDQADADDDMVGDACDPCPLDPMTTTCRLSNPDDDDRDGVVNAMDNCKDVANPMQEDGDSDMIGNACDACPMFSNAGGAPCVFTIYELKQQKVTGAVRVENALVTAVAPNGYFLQVVPGDAAYSATLGARFSGLFVFTGAAGQRPARGDRVDVNGTAGDFYGQEQIVQTAINIRTSNNALPAPIQVTAAEVATGGARAEELEAVLIEVSNARVTNVDPDPGAREGRPTYAFEVEGGLRVDDLMYRADPFPAMGLRIGYIRGVLMRTNDLSKLQPRDGDDIALSPSLAGFEPTFAAVPAGATSNALAIRLTRTASTPTMIALSSSSMMTTVPASVTVQAGSDRAQVPIEPGPARTGTVAITASFRGDTATAFIRVYDDATPRDITSLTIAPMTMIPGTRAQVSLRLDLPAPSMGAQVMVSVDPPALAMAPASVTLGAGTSSIAFTLTTSSAVGIGRVIATLGSASNSASFEVTRSVRREPVPGDLILTEIHRDPNGPQPEKTREWIEVYNTSSDFIVIDGLTIEDNAGPMAAYTVSGTNQAIPPGGYAVFAYSTDPAVNGGVTAVAAYGDADLQLGNDADRISIGFGGMDLDEVVWVSSWRVGRAGASMCLKFPYATNRTVVTAWGSSTQAWAMGDLGSPGAASTPQNCP